VGYTPPPDTGSWTGFLAITAAGLILLAWRRSKIAWATMLIVGTAGAFMYSFGAPGFVAALWFGVPLALLTTRSLLGTAIGLVALALAMLPRFLSEDAGVVSAIVLLLVALVPQRAEVMRETSRSL
jgi:hypothetical protein